ncbi:MAG TPA: N-methyl-L-tryptophan oxidase [Rhizomicrobium sp.]|nr:N-methyl-L-tryptophan oxidase [Rhizomicrobium sp.]
MALQRFDVAVLGLGALGSAALFQLSRRGARVLGLDQFAPPHKFGSTHGGTRITREAIGEGAHLTPLVRRSHTLWREIEQETGTQLFIASGVLVISATTKTSRTHVANFFDTTVTAARDHRILHEIWGAETIRRRFPQFRVGDREIAYYEPGGGFLRPEGCIAAQLELAARNRADIRLNERVTGFECRTANVLITTDKGNYVADRLLIAAGPWLPRLLDYDLAQLFQVFPQKQFWFTPRDDSFQMDRFPVFIWELSGPKQAIYGFPDIDGTGAKVATEQYEVTAIPTGVAEEVAPSVCRSMCESYVAPFLPGLIGTCAQVSTCFYTVTPDFGFVLDHHPASERVILASCCSGHGFKHSPALGEAIAELILDGRSRTDLSPFSLARFQAD